MVAGYRDSTYLYYPMFQWIDWQMEQGEFPLWMPYENTGFPLLADGTSSLLYPPKAIFWLRSFSFPARYGWFLALHVLWAAAGAYAMAKTLGANRWGAALAGISFAFGGSVLFQVCNVVYLVSASWLPWALTCVWKMNRNLSQQGLSQNIFWAITGSVCCSMIILGGDPQMVYHVGLIALMTLIAAQFRRTEKPRWPPVLHLVLLVIFTSALSAVQLLPTMEWARYSDRANSDVPMNIWHGDFGALVNLPDRPPVSDVYQFSQEPWSLLGLIYPNFFGCDAPINTRWSAAFAGAERIWTPSNYFGCLAFMLAVSGFTLWRGGAKSPFKVSGQGRAVRVWLSWIAVWFGIASFGWYGVGWLLTELGWTMPQGEEGTFNHPVGGLYWLMVSVLPKYCLFRYPAKLMVVSCLALSVLAGVSLKPRGIRRLGKLAWLAGAVGICGAIFMFTPQAAVSLQLCQRTSLFGPFQIDQSWNLILVSLLSTIGCCGLAIYFARCCRIGNAFQGRIRSSYLLGGIVLLLAIELTIHNRWMLHPIDAAVMTQTTTTETAIRELKQQRPPHQRSSALSVSVLKTNFENDRFFTESSNHRIAELATWRRETLFPKMHLLVNDVQLWGSFTSIWPLAFDQIPRDQVTDAKIKNVDNVAVVELAKGEPQHRSFAHAGWSGQTFNLTIEPRSGDDFKQLTLPILPMPGWQARFDSPELDEEIVAELKAADSLNKLPYDSLNSVVSIPPELRGKPCSVRCVYRPESFRWGLMISVASWILATIGSILLLRSTKKI